MKQLYHYSFLFVLFILQSCSFEPKGIHFVTVDPTPKTPNIQINLNFNTDTLYIPNQKSITFAYGMSSKEVIWSKLIINGKETSPMTYSQDTVKMTWTFLDNAGTVCPLEMQILYRSHTGSLGDNIGAEGVLFTKKWIMKVMDYNQLASTITKADFVDGTLKLDWTRFPGTEFTSYKIYKQVHFSSQPLQLLATITSRNQTTCLDNTYHGEISDYYILTNDYFRGQTKNVTGPIPTLSSTNSQTGELILKWTKPPFYKNLRGYRIKVYDNNLGSTVQLADVMDGASESYNVPTPLFGESKEYFMTLLPLTNSYYDEMDSGSWISTNVFASYGFPSPKFDYAFAGMAPISYLLVNYSYESIYVFDHQKMTTTRKISVDNGVVRFQVSANNKYLVALGSNNTIFFDYLTDTTKSKKLVLKDFPKTTGYYSVSELGTGVFINNQNAIVYDYLNEQKLAEIKLVSSSTNTNKISPSGNFFCCTSYGSSYEESFRYKDNQITKLPTGNLSFDPLYYYDFLPGTNEKLVLVRSNRIEVLDCNTWVIEHTWQLPNGFTEFYNLDKNSGKVLFREKNKLILFDVITGTRVELRDIAGNPNYRNTWPLFYNNGLLFGGNGNAIY
jgi:hypothetical protein